MRTASLRIVKITVSTRAPIRLSDDGPSLFSSNDVVVDVHLVVGEHLLDFLGSYVVNGDVRGVRLVPVESDCIRHPYSIHMAYVSGKLGSSGVIEHHYQQEPCRRPSPTAPAPYLKYLINKTSFPFSL